jgi:hypothetical protein
MHGKACDCATVTGRECVARVPAAYSADRQAYRSESGEGRCTRKAAGAGTLGSAYVGAKCLDRNAGLLGRFGSSSSRQSKRV